MPGPVTVSQSARPFFARVSHSSDDELPSTALPWLRNGGDALQCRGVLQMKPAFPWPRSHVSRPTASRTQFLQVHMGLKCCYSGLGTPPVVTAISVHVEFSHTSIYPSAVTLAYAGIRNCRPWKVIAP